MPASIDVVFTPDLLPFSDLTGKTVVVADILRATTTITFAVANGATAITPVLTPEDAFRLAADQSNTLIGGERGGMKVDGFDLGNSPREYTEAVVSGQADCPDNDKRHTRTLQACRAAEQSPSLDLSSTSAPLSIGWRKWKGSLSSRVLAGKAVSARKILFLRVHAWQHWEKPN